jgi:hypothetical protein
MAFVGMRSARGRRPQAGPEGGPADSGSPLSIIRETFAPANFFKEENRALCAQRTEAAGQIFGETALERVWLWTEAGPGWLARFLNLFP